MNMKTIMSRKNNYDLIHNLFFSEAEAHRLKRSRVSINTQRLEMGGCNQETPAEEIIIERLHATADGPSSRRYRKGRLLGKVCACCT